MPNNYLNKGKAGGGNKSKRNNSYIPYKYEQFVKKNGKPLYHKGTLHQKYYIDMNVIIPIGDVLDSICTTNPSLAMSWAKGEI